MRPAKTEEQGGRGKTTEKRKDAEKELDRRQSRREGASERGRLQTLGSGSWCLPWDFSLAEGRRSRGS